MKREATTFFKQSGWMVIATVLSGAFMFFVHKIASTMPKPQYSVFTTMLSIVNLLGIPASGLQIIFAQQAAAAIDESERKRLTGCVRWVLAGTFVFWLLTCIGFLGFQKSVLSTLKIGNAATLWFTILVGLMQLWLPIIMGLLQGAQNFAWLGATSIINGVGRFAAVGVLVGLFTMFAAGAMFGVFVGMFTALVLGAWHSRAMYSGESLPMKWKPWLRRVVPLTLGLGANIFIMSADLVVVQTYFDEKETGFYAAAAMIGRGLVFFTVPLAAVMFPKIVKSAASAEKSDVLLLTVGVTALMGVMAAVGCTLFPSLPLRILYSAEYLKIAPLVPWFAWCMLPLTISYVLINNLLARERFEAVPWLVVVAAGYGTALVTFATSFIVVAKIIGIFSLILVAVSLWFSLRGKPTASGPST